MIGIHASVNWNGGRMKVNLVVKGRAEHPLEHLYTECIREGLRQALQVANAKEIEMDEQAKATNIKVDLPASPAVEPAPLGENAVEIPFELPGAAPIKPPSFTEFITGLMEEFSRSVEFEKARPQPNDEMIVCNQAAAALIQEKAREYMQQLMAWHQAQAAAQPGDPSA